MKSESKKSNFLPLFTVATFGLHLFTFLILTFHWSMLRQLQQRLTPQSLVQLVDGRAITVDPKPDFTRYPETVRRFVGETMTLMLNWSQQQQPQAVWQTTSALVSNNLKPKLESMISPTQTLSQGTENILVIQNVGQPTQISEGKWKVDIIANQLIFTNADRLGKTVPFNKQILVQAVEAPVASLPNSPLPLNLAVSRLGEARLQIYNVCDINDKSCS
ncbi:MAG: hypothetical protein IGS39_18755 [Calothrix sp. C42_A2020_038]|nr:hypothetical protein [Calothrix sp. C42_A2020_038]